MQENYMEQTGRIFDIQKFSTHDGPGIRTIVFLKGCVLRCRWCCNPESQSTKIETMNQNDKLKTIGYDTTVREIIKTVVQDMPYYRRSGGGLTLSGGECLVQPEFSAALLRAAKEEYGLSTAVESTACAPYETVQTLLPYLDWYLMDIKHTNPEKHKAFTGRDNALILENAKKLARDAKNLVIRVPVIPTFNDAPEEILSIARFAASLGSVKQLHLLPYHRLGYDKYVGLGRDYGMGDVLPAGRTQNGDSQRRCRKYGTGSSDRRLSVNTNFSDFNDNAAKQRIIQELVPGKQITLAHIIAAPDAILYRASSALTRSVDYARSAIGIVTMTPAEYAIIAADLAIKKSAAELGFVDRFSGTLIVTGKVDEVEASLAAVTEYAERALGFKVCAITKT